MNLEKYLERIGLTKNRELSLEFLAVLQEKHLLSIPFEDLDIPDRDTITIDVEKFYEKIVIRKRGGFCYELNGLFSVLLRELGFSLDLVSARAYNETEGTFGPEFDHLALLVHLDKTYLVDVGFGDSLRKPIEMPDGEAEDISGKYKIAKGSKNEFILMHYKNKSWKPDYLFTTIPRKLEDFAEMCAFQQNDPQSHFRKRRLCTIATAKGRVTLSDNMVSVTEDGLKNQIRFNTEDEFFRYLKEYFNITLTKREA